MLKEDINPDGVKIYFIESEHKYYTDKVKNFTSVTTFVESFFPEFEREKISCNYARKYGLSQSDVLAEWDKKADVGRKLGTNVHEFCEAYILNKELPEPVSEKAKVLFGYSVEKLDNLLKDFSLVASEKIIFSEKLKLCGTADLLLREKSTGRLILLDFKTNRFIDKTNKYGKFALPPFTQFDDNNFTHYLIQLNTYRKLLLLENYFDEEIHMGIIHFTEKGVFSHKIRNADNNINQMIEYFCGDREIR